MMKKHSVQISSIFLISSSLIKFFRIHFLVALRVVVFWRIVTVSYCRATFILSVVYFDIFCTAWQKILVQ